MPEKVYVYGLRCPRTNKFRYVGKTHTPVERYLHHVKLRTGSNWSKEAWLKELQDPVERPGLVILEEMDHDGLPYQSHGPNWEVEQRWIMRLLAEGHPLLNVKLPAAPNVGVADLLED